MTSIGAWAFTCCSGLTSVEIPNRVSEIGEGAFQSCSNLISITIPNSVTSIGKDAFNNCPSLTDVKVPVSDFSSFCNNSVVGLIKDKIAKPVTLVDNEGKEIKELVIPDDVTSIGNYAFFNCSGLTSVTVKCSPTSIGMNPFGACTNLKEVTFDCETVTSLFSYSSSIEKVTMTERVTSIGYAAFAGCSSLASITIPNSVNHIGYGAFTDTAWYDNQPDGIVYAGKVIIGYKGTMPEGLDIKDGTVSIASHAFAFQRGLTSITIPNSMISIDGYAFYGCLGIVDVFCYAEKVPRLDREAFFWEDVDDFYTFHSRITLHVPASSIEAYKAADIWSEFKEIVAIEEETDVDEIKISSAGQTTWCSAYDLDFTNVEGLKAYIASGYHRTKGTIWLTRVKEVPAGEGILLIGDEGEYKVPHLATTAYYANLMVGTVEAITLNETDGEYTNYYLSNGASGIGFYKVNGSVDIKANRAYLPLLKNTVSSTRGFIGIDFDDDSDGTTGINLIENGKFLDEPSGKAERNIENEVYYNLQGQRVEKPEKGIYIRNGKKVIVK